MESSSPEYMRQCLIRTIYGWRNRERIAAFLALWEKKHGEESATQLKAELNDYREQQRQLARG